MEVGTAQEVSSAFSDASGGKLKCPRDPSCTKPSGHKGACLKRLASDTKPQFEAKRVITQKETETKAANRCAAAALKLIEDLEAWPLSLKAVARITLKAEKWLKNKTNTEEPTSKALTKQVRKAIEALAKKSTLEGAATSAPEVAAPSKGKARNVTSNGLPAVVPAVHDAGSRYAVLSAQDYKVQGLITEAQHAQKVKLTLTRTLIVTLNLTRTLTLTIPEPDPDR